MKRVLIFISVVAVMFMCSIKAHADLELLGQGTSYYGTHNLIYDTDFNITWYDFTLPSYTWDNKVEWADWLTVTFGSNTYTNWRLPSTVDGPYDWDMSGTTTAGYNITSSEMGHLFYAELGNAGYCPPDATSYPSDCLTSGYGLTNTSFFQNLQEVQYWSGTEYSADPDRAWWFNMGLGLQGRSGKSSSNYAMIVMDGRAETVVPEPVSSVLFIVGGAALGFRRFRKK